MYLRAPAAFCGGGFFVTQRREGEDKDKGKEEERRKEPGWMSQPGIA